MIGATTKITRKNGSKRAFASIVPGIAHNPFISADCEVEDCVRETQGRKETPWITHVDVVDEVEQRSFDCDQEHGEREVATVLEEAVVQEAASRSLPLCRSHAKHVRPC